MNDIDQVSSFLGTTLAYIPLSSEQWLAASPHYIIALSLIFAGVVLGRYGSSLILSAIAWLSGHAGMAMGANKESLLLRPIGFAILTIMVNLAVIHLIEQSHLPDYFHTIAITFIMIAVVRLIIAFIHSVSLISWIMKRSRLKSDPAIISWIDKTAQLAIIALGFLTILMSWGFNIGPILAGLGIFGLAIAFGMQDLVRNVIGGLGIMMEKRFRVHDIIGVAGVVEGMVENVGFRSTQLRQFDKRIVYVPNADLWNTALINYSNLPYRRVNWAIGVEYRTTAEQMRRVRDTIYAFIEKHPGFATDEEAGLYVYWDCYSASSIDLLVYCFTYDVTWSGWLSAKQELLYKIKEILEAEGVGFAFPSQSLYVESLPKSDAMMPDTVSAPPQRITAPPPFRRSAKPNPAAKRGGGRSRKQQQNPGNDSNQDGGD